MANRRPALGVIAFANLCELMVTKPPHSREWFRTQIGVGLRTMDKYMRLLIHKKLIYVADWTTGGKRVSTRIALWTWGYNREDAPRPTPVPRHIVNRNSKRRRAAAKKDWRNGLLAGDILAGGM